MKQYKSILQAQLLARNILPATGVLILFLGLLVVLCSRANGFAVSGVQPSGGNKIAGNQIASGQVKAANLKQQSPVTSSAKARGKTKAKSKTASAQSKPFNMVVLNIDGIYLDRPDVSVLSFSGVKSNSIMRFTSTIRRIAHDKDVDALLLNFEQPVLDWSQVDDFRQAIYKLRAAGKKTYAYVEAPGQIEYLLACACDKVIMTPAGSLEMTGLAGETMYYKGLFDKLGIKADFIHMGNYKGAIEPLTKTAPSQYQKYQMNHLFDGLYAHMLSSIAKSRHLKPQEVSKIIDQGPFSPEQARSRHLIDYIMYRNEFIGYLNRQHNNNVYLKLDYDTKRQVQLPLDNPVGILSALQGIFASPPEEPGPTIAVVYIDGAITSGNSAEGFGGSTVGSRTLRLTLNRARNDRDVKAVVLRINSPGGSAIASDIIYHAIRQFNNSNDPNKTKPVIVSMGSVAASGGYYIACGGQTLIAEASTITGSIGVLGGKIVYGGLLRKLGLSTYTVHRGRNSLIVSATNTFTPLQREKLHRDMEHVYGIFKQCVVSSRGKKLKYNIEELAQGKVYTGRQALAVGLIDRIGSLDDAIQLAAKRAGLKRGQYHIRNLPRLPSLMDLLQNMLGMNDSSSEDIGGDNGNNHNGRSNASLGLSIALLKNIMANKGFNIGETGGISALPELFNQPLLLRAVNRLSNLVRLIRNEQTLLIMPFDVIIH